jgi:hypothetical protein
LYEVFRNDFDKGPFAWAVPYCSQTMDSNKDLEIDYGNEVILLCARPNESQLSM